MKTYEKPTFDLVSLSTNTAFCSCQVNLDDILNKIPGVFADLTSCKIPADSVVEDYCKFTGADGNAFSS